MAAYGKRQRREVKLRQTTGAAGPRGHKRLRWTGIPRKPTGSSSGARCTQTGGGLPAVTSTRLRAGARVLRIRLKRLYGVTGDVAEQQIKSFEARNQHPRPVSFR